MFTFSISVELSDGSKVDAAGELKSNPNPEEPAFITSKGSYEYVSPEGELIHVDWTADETGFHAEVSFFPNDFVRIQINSNILTNGFYYNIYRENTCQLLEFRELDFRKPEIENNRHTLQPCIALSMIVF